MKKLLCCLLVSVCFAEASQENVINLSSPAEYIDYTKLEESVDQWTNEVLPTLNEQEVLLVKRFLQLGLLFAGIDLRVRQAVRSLLPSVWQLQQTVTKGAEGLSCLNQIEEQNKELRNMLTSHAMLLKQWRDWTTVLSACENQKVLKAVAIIDEQIRQSIEGCIDAREWQKITDLVPEVLADSARTGQLLISLCQLPNKNTGEEVAPEEESVSEEQKLFEQSMTHYSWLVNAAAMVNERSWESLKAVSQILIYEEALLVISGVIYNRYFRVISPQGLEESLS
jgi:hypothetical protein